METNNPNKTQQRTQKESSLSTQSLQIIKQSLPFLDISSQRQLSMLIKVIEFKNTMKSFSNNSMFSLLQAQDSNTSGSSAPQNNKSLMDIFSLMNSGLFNGGGKPGMGGNASNSMLPNMMMLLNMMSGMNQPVNNSNTSSQMQKPPDLNGLLSTFKTTLPDDQKNMFDMFSTLMQANSIQERNSANNENVQQQSTSNTGSDTKDK
ncbi:MAG: hypothetical protein K0R15_219 [Clostridiales bacterium]|jgi:hypothetical protein|nr:hypothetical protein [Clostridiales bacterium]